MKYISLSTIVASGLLAANLTLGADASTTVFPLPVEPGTDAYNKTAITGIVAGSSFVRFTNLRGEATRNHVEIYGLTDKQTLGSFTVDVPAKATVQIQPERMIYTFAPVNWNQPIVLYVENGRDKQVWQHLKLNAATGDFSDASVCVTPPHLDYAAPGNAALDVFPGVFPGGLARYTSTVSVHNFSGFTGRYEAHVYDAATGQQLGAVAFELPARQSFIRQGSYFSQLVAAAAAKADDSRFFNVEFVSVGDPNARITVGHDVTDASGRTVNLSNPCPLTGGLVTIQTGG